MKTTKPEMEKLVEINEIYKELIEDAYNLTRDLVGSIKQWLLGAAFMFLVAVLFVWFFVLPSWSSSLFSALIYMVNAGFLFLTGGLFVYQFWQLRKKYARLFGIQKELENE